MSRKKQSPYEDGDDAKFVVAPKHHKVKHGGMPVKVKGSGKTVARKKHHKKSIGK